MSSRDLQSRNARQEALRVASQGNGSIENGWREDLASQEYLDALEKYQGHPLYSELVNNPYRYFYQSPSALGTFGDETGLWQSSYTKNRLQAKQAFQEAYLAAMQKINAYDVNLPSNQANLERQAGLNPDLTGISGSATVTDADNPINSPAYAANDEMQAAQQFSQVGLSFITSLFNIGQSVQDFQSKGFEIASQEIRNNKDAKDFVIESIAESAPFDDVNELNNASIDNLSDYVLDAASKTDFSGYSPYTRKLLQRTFRKYDTLLRSGRDTLGVAAFKAELRDKFVQHQSSAAKGASQKGFTESFPDFVKWFSENFSEAEFKLQKKGLDVQDKVLDASKAAALEGVSESKYNKKYFDYASGQGLFRDAVDSEKQSYLAQKNADSAQAIINETWDETIKFLRGGNNWWNSIGILLAAYFRSVSLHMPSINVSGPKTTNNSWSNSYDSHDYNQKKSVNRFANQ